ncbi:MAG: septum formation initiator family protein [Romboutsia sp.]|nr:septum formation initiator family protein [Romboutsia sp.]
MTGKKKNKKSNGRFFLFTLLFFVALTYLGYNLYTSICDINSINKEKDELESRIVGLQEEEKKLESDIQKLQDPTYIARYAREKYLYSKDGELIIRLPDDNKEK